MKKAEEGQDCRLLISNCQLMERAAGFRGFCLGFPLAAMDRLEVRY
jgi:hypothetical protein